MHRGKLGASCEGATSLALTEAIYLRLSYYLYLPFNDRIILLNRKYSHIGRFGVEAVRENNVVELIPLGPLDITAGRVRLGFGVGVVVGIHFAVVVVDIVGDMQEVFRA